ncbi:sirohydrochlorin cobaltochelatase [Megalodesulfovibrio gigas]|uniref:Putative anaerobic cobalt chelatase n=1 Tax=Megalodesulfovibrio gigas (strain ATCC 19364 / DSM 1382 / NCIMB 9332 / VKM B-1759) TaxID=1121448 RepID=T2GB35_MEGG1|nr:sirohydrochlorin cobaltochelatase [Megalodesulfovibrio gigas]AGW13389.1 putative anaerobic cobalt chelatase [Megalodesulfovibrio gigas DSM 1382 = ATCC 19364]
MKQALCLVALLLVICMLGLRPAQAHGGHKSREEARTAILLVAFGTSYATARGPLQDFEARVRAKFPGVEVRWAWSSHQIRQMEGAEEVDSPAEALARLMEDRFTHVAVQSLQTIPGQEFHMLMETARRFQGMPKGLKRVAVGLPLLGSPEDFNVVADALLAGLPKTRTAKDAVVFMGHGTHHVGNAMYPALQYYLWKRDAMAFMGTVEGSPSLDDIVADLARKKPATVWLLPFMAVAGDHANNDMAGDEEDSWKSVLTKAGYTVQMVLAGTLENADLADLWLAHLEAAMASLQE